MARRKPPLTQRLRDYCGDDYVNGLLAEAAKRIETLERLDSQAAQHVESVICMRTKFTGSGKYVGWKGLGLALNEAIDERDTLRAFVDDHTITEQHS